MSVIHQAGGNMLPRRPTQSSRPNCTHVDMDRLYGPFSCDLCQHPSPFGWLYKCSQDYSYEHPALPVDSVMESIKIPSQIMARTLTEELQAMDFSRSIIAQAEAGGYTPAQIKLLKSQKQHLLDIIAAEPPLTPIPCGQQPYGPTFFQPLAAVVEAVKSSQTAGHGDLPLASRNVTPLKNSPSKLPARSICRFKCCARCRPYLIDRCFTSFDAVYEDELRPLSVTDTKILPIKSPQIARTIGLTGSRPVFGTVSDADSPRSLPSINTHCFFDSGANTPSTHQTTPTTGSTTATTSSFPYSEDSGSSSEEDDERKVNWEGGFGSAHYTNGQGSTLIYARPSRTISTPNMGKQRTIRHVSGSVDKDSSPARSDSSRSSLSLPTPTTASTSPMPRLNFEDKEARTRHERECEQYSCSSEHSGSAQNGSIISDLGLLSPWLDLSRSSSTDSMDGHLGDEMEVDGGVALTEEAVRTHTPDIITRKDMLDNMQTQDKLDDLMAHKDLLKAVQAQDEANDLITRKDVLDLKQSQNEECEDVFVTRT
ncbi:hypothetical protein BDV97DRAFT_371901 [Delphinella strobiligena]|nr:hypothetical protein BDV97DRAFT_371901 [Delphinella strobiligena]